MAYLGAHLTHIGPGRVHIALPTRPEVTQQQSGRTLTACQPEVYGVQGDGARKLVANGQQALIRAEAQAVGPQPLPS